MTWTGDCILGHGTTHFTELHPYMTSLRSIRAMNPTQLYPAHGAIIKDGCTRVDEYIKHRDEREQQIMKVVQSHEGITCMEIVKVICKYMHQMTVQAGGTSGFSVRCSPLALTLVLFDMCCMFLSL